MRRAGLAALAVAGVAVGVLAERQRYAWPDLRDWLPDLLTGWTLIALAIVLLALRRPPGAAALLLVAGFAWFVPNFETTGPEALRSLAGQAAYLHRAPLLALALALPTGRPATRLAAGGVTLAWTAAVLWPLWENDVTALVLAGAFVGVAFFERRRAPGRRSRAVVERGLLAVTILATAISVDAIRSLAGAGALGDATVLGYAAAVAAVGVVLFRAALLDAPAALAEQAVGLEHAGATLRDALRDLLGDRSLELGFDIGGGALVDDAGRPLAVPAAGTVATPVSVAGVRVAVIVHDPATLADDATRSAVLAAVGLAAERARLRAQVDAQVQAVEASRRRLLLAEEEERRRLADRLERGPVAQLDGLDRLVGDARLAADGDSALAAALDRAFEQLARVLPELEAPAQGLRVVAERGLGGALRELAANQPIHVDLELVDVAVPPAIGSALWFVCSESLANVVKHADADSVRIVLSAGEAVARVVVEDDGRGGADRGGSGLLGLADRVGALGGYLRVDSPVGGGTRVEVELPSEGTSPTAGVGLAATPVRGG